MKAIVYHKKGSPEKYTLQEVERPLPGAGEVLIQVQTASVNAADYRSVKMGITPKSGILGSGVAGIISEVGPGVKDYQPGDAVVVDLADLGFGGFAEYASAPATALCRIPPNLSYIDAATLPVAATTALHALRDKGAIQAGQEVLIVGSSGGVGGFAVQLANYFGAVVTAVCSTRNKEQSLALGADRVIDYTQQDFTRMADQYDLVVAVNGNYSLLRCRRILKPGGTYVMVGGSLSQIFKALLFGRLLSMGSKSVKALSSKANAQDLFWLAGLMAAGKLKGQVEKVYPLSETGAAMTYLMEGHARGKVVIEVVSDQR